MSPASSPVLVAFLGGHGDSPIELTVARVRMAATLDTIESALAWGAVRQALLVTDGAVECPGMPGLDVDSRAGEFRFGRRLADVISRHGLDSVIYLGGGSASLLTGKDFAAIASRAGNGIAVTNNQYSSDLVAFRTTPELPRIIEGVDRDNALARTLADSEVSVEELPRTAETLFDIDGPTEIAALKVTGAGGTRLRAAVESVDIETAAYERLLPLFLDRQKQLLVAGRVGSHVWRYLETETACRVRLVAEERGMEADGRVDASTARSILGSYLEAVGIENFFSSLDQFGDAALIDSRVLAAHIGARPSREDRFLSDAGRGDDIADPLLRDLTVGAQSAPIPVLLGGHSLMSGTLMLLNEWAWCLRDRSEL